MEPSSRWTIILENCYYYILCESATWRNKIKKWNIDNLCDVLYSTWLLSALKIRQETSFDKFNQAKFWQAQITLSLDLVEIGLKDPWNWWSALFIWLLVDFRLRITNFLLQYMTEKMGGAEGTKLDVDFVDMERVSNAFSHLCMC